MLVCWGNLNQIYFTVKLILCKGQKCKNTRQQCQLKLKMNQSSSIKKKLKKRFLLWGVDVGTLTRVTAIIALKIKTFDLCWKLLLSRSFHTWLQKKPPFWCEARKVHRCWAHASAARGILFRLRSIGSKSVSKSCQTKKIFKKATRPRRAYSSGRSACGLGHREQKYLCTGNAANAARAIPTLSATEAVAMENSLCLSSACNSRDKNATSQQITSMLCQAPVSIYALGDYTTCNITQIQKWPVIY